MTAPRVCGIRAIQANVRGDGERLVAAVTVEFGDIIIAGLKLYHREATGEFSLRSLATRNAEDRVVILGSTRAAVLAQAIPLYRALAAHPADPPFAPASEIPEGAR